MPLDLKLEFSETQSGIDDKVYYMIKLQGGSFNNFNNSNFIIGLHYD